MFPVVQLKYNPYIPRLSITIDEKPISEYSTLAQYTDEDIWTWKDSIFSDIYSEVRENYIVEFCGRKYDADILKSSYENNSCCHDFIFNESVISESVQKRLVALNKYLKNNGITLFRSTRIIAHFIIDSSIKELQKDIEGITIKNSYCKVIIDTKSRTIDLLNENNYLFIIVSDRDYGINLANNYKSNNPVYIICIDDSSTKSKVITEQFIMVNANYSNIIDIIFECFLNYPLLIPIRNCISSLSEDIKNEPSLQIIGAINPIVIINVNKIVEVGRSNKIEISTFPHSNRVPEIVFKTINSSIVSTDNRYIYGKSAGTTLLEAYIPGDAKPFQTIEINSIIRNRIKKLILDEDCLVIGKGRSHNFKFDYAPTDADNVDCVTWKSSDESIITVDSKGQAKCIGLGECRIICLAENISAQCRCIVKPYLEDIIIESPKIDDGHLVMFSMEEQNIVLKTIPNDCIDSELTISSSNYDVVNCVNGKLIAKNKGDVDITISNRTKTMNKVIHVKVKKKFGGLLKRKK